MKFFPSLLFAFIFFTGFSSSLLAQNSETEHTDFIKQWETAYNKKDVQALKALYTNDAVLTGPTGAVVKSNDSIVHIYALDFAGTDETARMNVTVDKTETATDGQVMVSGSWQASGKIKSGKAYLVKGNYSNTMVREDGKWKIARSVITQKQSGM